MSGNTKRFHTPEDSPATPFQYDKKGWFSTPEMRNLRQLEARVIELEAMKTRCEDLLLSWSIVDANDPNIVLWINKKHFDELKKAIEGNNT
jgi:hypothetical protein